MPIAPPTAETARPPHLDSWGEPSRDLRRGVVFTILLLTFVLYAPSIGNDFTWDDRFAAMGSGPTRQPLVAELHPLADYFASNWWPQHSPTSQAYRPLATLWFALRYAVCGDQALVAHLASVLLHTLSTGLAFLLLRRLGAAFWPAALGCGVFGLHAIHSEAVANLVGSAELLALCFGLLATLGMPATLVGTLRRRWLAQLGTAVLLFAAFASKESGVGWAVFAPLCCLLPRWRAGATWSQLGRDLRRLLPTIAAPAALYLTLRANMLAALPATTDSAVGLLENPLLGLPAGARAASGLLAWGYGLLLTVLPCRLSVDYGPDQLPVLTQWQDPWSFVAIGTAVVFTALGVIACRSARRVPLLALGVAGFFATSMLVSNIVVPVFMQFADRSYTTPSLGFAIAVAGLAGCWPARRFARWSAGLAVAGWLVVSVATAWPRNFVFADDATLIVTEVANSPRSVRLQLCAAMLQLQRGQVEAARLHLATAAQLAPHLPQPWLELASLALRQRDWPTATSHLEAAAAGDPRELPRHLPRLQALRRELAAASPR